MFPCVGVVARAMAKLGESKQDMCGVAMDKKWRSSIDVDAVRVVKTGQAVEILSNRILRTRVLFTRKSLLPGTDFLVMKRFAKC